MDLHKAFLFPHGPHLAIEKALGGPLQLQEPNRPRNQSIRARGSKPNPSALKLFPGGVDIQTIPDRCPGKKSGAPRHRHGSPKRRLHPLGIAMESRIPHCMTHLPQILTHTRSCLTTKHEGTERLPFFSKAPPPAKTSTTSPLQIHGGWESCQKQAKNHAMRCGTTQTGESTKKPGVRPDRGRPAR